MALKCGTVIYRRPCRSKPRVYKVCDAARIAGYVAENYSRQAVVGTIGFKLGMFVLVDASSWNEGELDRLVKEFLGLDNIKKQIPKLLSRSVPVFIIKLAGAILIKWYKLAFAVIGVEFVLWLIDKQRLRFITTCEDK